MRAVAIETVADRIMGMFARSVAGEAVPDNRHPFLWMFTMAGPTARSRMLLMTGGTIDFIPMTAPLCSHCCGHINMASRAKLTVRLGLKNDL